jgi:EAL domain-containing protein (putative c-di-GMP-specific phosphodiesterase class I)/FixJ family two-component response regulator
VGDGRVREEVVMSDSVLTGCRILIVDDDEASVKLTTRMLQKAGYVHIKGLTDARAAVDARRHWAPDLVLLDMHMPYVDGISLLHAFRGPAGSFDYVPVLILTADVSRETLKMALAAGANDYVTKPVDIDEVLMRVRNLLSVRLSYENLRHSNAELATAIRYWRQSEDLQAELRQARITAIRGVIDRGPTIVFQPIVELVTTRTVGVEALTRFDDNCPPDQWFAEAGLLGLGTELEMSAVNAAFSHLDRLGTDQFLAVNVSPAVLADPRMLDLLLECDPGRLVVEVTENQPVTNYPELNAVRERLHEAGIRIAVDDAGAGYAGLQQILELAPEIIKLDIALTRDIDRDPIKRALAGALITFARESHATVTAEGIETASELETLSNLAVPWGQGYHIGRPSALNSREWPPSKLAHSA